MSTFIQLLIKEGGRCGDKGVPECLFSCDWLFVSPWTVAHQAPLSMEFSGKNTGVNCHFQAVVFPVVMYGCESWTVKEAEC